MQCTPNTLKPRLAYLLYSHNAITVSINLAGLPCLCHGHGSSHACILLHTSLVMYARACSTCVSE